MATTTDYGTFQTVTGTSVADVAGAIKGKPAKTIIAFFYDTGATQYVAVIKKTLDAT